MIKKIVLIELVILQLIFSCGISNAVNYNINNKDNEIKNEYYSSEGTTEYSEDYKKYLQLNDEEKEKIGVIPRKYDIPFDEIYLKLGMQKNTVLEKIKAIQNILFLGKSMTMLEESNEQILPKSYILMGEDTNKDGSVNENDIKVDGYGGINIRVEDQDGYGLCWAFAAIKSLETNLALNGCGEYDFSELHLDYLQSDLFRNQTYRSLHKGGNFTNFENYINLEDGPVLEEEVPYYSEYSTIKEYEYLEGLLQKVKVNKEDFINLPSINKATTTYTDEELRYFRSKVKEHISKNGSLEASIYSMAIGDSVDKKNQVLNYQGDHIADHSISIIGWDDNFSKENFPTNCRPKNNGAYIALNSYGKEWGNYGIFYISYEDILVEKSMNGLSNAYLVEVLDIYVEKEPDNINYIIGESFKTDGMVVKAKYPNGEDKEITGYTIYPEIINKDIDYITISYTEGNSTKTTKQNINVYDIKENVEDKINIYYDNNKILVINGTGVLKSNLDNYDAEKIIIEEGIKEVSLDIFNRLTNLNRIYILDKDCTISNNFGDNDNIPIIYCYKESSIEKYCETNQINYFAYDNYYKCGKNVYAFLNKNDKKLSISGTGNIYEYTLNEIPWKKEELYTNNVEFDDGVKNISNKLFAENTNIETVKLGKDITELGEYAFYSCTNLSQIELNEKLEIINKNAFNNCTNLGKINIPDSVKDIKEYCFYNCIKLEEVKLPENIRIIEKYTFYNCILLKEVTLPDNIISLQSYAFMKCTNLEEIKLPKNLEVLGNFTFNSCTNLKKVDFSDSNPTRIGDATFNKCYSLEEFIMPDSITFISQGLFGECKSLKSLEFSHGLTRLYDGVAQHCTALEEISIPYGIKIIGNMNFSGGSNIKKVILPCSLETIGSNNFALCNKLQYLIIPDSLIINAESDLLGKCSANPVIYCKSNSSIKEYADNNEINYIIDDTSPSLEVTKESIQNGKERITIIAKDDNNIVGLSDYPYSFDGGETWQPESYIDIEESAAITVCVRDGVGNIATKEIIITKELSSIEITKAPTKIDYIEGEEFDDTGMKVEATYNNGDSKEITGYTVTNGENLKVGQESVTISYTENGVTKEVNQAIKVEAKTLSSIEITKAPTKIDYIEGENFDERGMKVEANYNNGDRKEITGYTVTNGENLKAGQESVKISYTENGVTKEASQVINVTKKEEKLEVKLKAEVEYKIEEEQGYIENIKPKTILEELLSKIETNGEIKVYKDETEISKEEELATGMKIKITKGEEIKEYTLIVIGDCNGSGTTNVADLTRLMMSRAEELAQKKDETKILKGCYRKAIDFNKDNKINISDITNLCMFIANNK